MAGLLCFWVKMLYEIFLFAQRRRVENQNEKMHMKMRHAFEGAKKKFLDLQVCDELCVCVGVCAWVCVRVMTAHIKRGLKIYVQEFYNLIACC